MKWVAEMWLDVKIFLFLYTKNLEAWSVSEMQKNRVSVTLTRKGMWCIHILYRLYQLNYSLWLILWISLQRYKNAWWQSWLTHLVVLSQLLFKWAARDSRAHNSAKAKVHTEWLSTMLQICLDIIWEGISCGWMKPLVWGIQHRGSGEKGALVVSK